MAGKKSYGPSALREPQEFTSSESMSVDLSQEAELQHMEAAVKQRRQRVREQRAQCSKTILAAHDARIEELKSEIQRCAQHHDDRIRAVRRANVQRLLDLVVRKSKLQSHVDNSYAELQAAFLSAAGQFRLALEGRIEEMS